MTEKSEIAGHEDSMWQMTTTVHRDLADPVERLMSDSALSVSVFEVEGGDFRRLDALFACRPDSTPLEALLRAHNDSALHDVFRVRVDRMPATDWVALSQESLPPVRVGRYFVHGAHDRSKVPEDAIGIQIDAGPAFGTGHHESTVGCLQAIDKIARTEDIRRPLDLGCGSGILAIAMARTWAVNVLASDADPKAVAETIRNAVGNGVGQRITAITSTGFDHPQLRPIQPHDMITANILAEPLIEMAPEMGRRLAPGGRLVLSGLLTEQEASVVTAYKAEGLNVQWRKRSGAWSTLIMSR